MRRAAAVPNPTIIGNSIITAFSMFDLYVEPNLSNLIIIVGEKYHLSEKMIGVKKNSFTGKMPDFFRLKGLSFCGTLLLQLQNVNQYTCMAAHIIFNIIVINKLNENRKRVKERLSTLKLI